MKKNVQYTLLILSILICYQVNAKSYYVSKSGNDSKQGTEEKPWKTVHYAVNHVNAGDTIYVRSGVYNELVTFNKSGNDSDGFITLQNYPNEKPILDGESLANSTSEAGLIKINNKSYIKVCGFELRNLKTSSGSQFPAGIWVKGASHHIELKNNLIHHIEQNISSGRGGAHGLAIYGTSSSSSLHDILIEGNEVRDCKLGWSESLVLNGNVEKFIVKNNIVHDNNNIAYDFIGHEGVCSQPSLDQARDGLVVGNIAYNIDSRLNAAYGYEDASADGFYVDGGKNIIFERNAVYQCNIGFEIASEHGGKSTSGIIVRNNLIYNNHVLGLAIGGYDKNRGSASKNLIVNNTFYKNDSDNTGWGAEILVQYYCADNEFKNNIVYSKKGTPFISHISDTSTRNLFNYNLFYTEGNGLWQWKETAYKTIAAFQSGSGQASHSIFNDPQFINPLSNNYRIHSQSPAIDAGININGIGITDFYGNARISNNHVDIGAAEYGVASINHHQQERINDGSAKTFRLLQNYPNPFNPATTITYVLKKANHVTVEIYNILGNNIETLVDQFQNQGHYQYQWNARQTNESRLTGGLYICKLKAGADQKTIKMLYVN